LSTALKILLIRYMLTWNSERDSYQWIYSQGSAPITTISETSSDPEDSETELNDSGEASNILKMERIFITGALDELKICFNYNRQVSLD